MTKFISFIATLLFIVILIRYEPSAMEAIFVFLFGFFMGIAGLFAAKEEDL
jgi:hypothetical protein